MRSFRSALALVWHQINPSEPGPHYLATFFATALVLFVIAFLIGQM